MRRGVLALLMAWACLTPAIVVGQSTRPSVVPRLTTDELSGDWYVAATSGTFALRRCLSDTRHHFMRRSNRTLEVRTVCATDRGLERRRGFLEGGKASDGRYSLRYAPLVLSWAPAAWSDFWVLDRGDGWLLVGDRRRRTVTVLSRTVALDESALARAIAAARTQGFDPETLRTVAHPSGGAGFVARP